MGASSSHSPKTVVANASYILGNIAFNARDFDYLESKIQYDKQGNKIDIDPSLGTKEVIYSATEGKLAAYSSAKGCSKRASR